MDVDLARQYMQYKREQGLPTDQDNCLYFIHFLLEQELPSNGVMWVSKEANQGIFHHAFQVIDKGAFARKYGILSDGKTIPKYDSIRRLLNNYAFHCDKKIIWYCSQLDEDGMRLFRPKKGYLLLKIKKKGYRTPSISYMYPGHDEEFWVPQYASPYNSFPIPALAPQPGTPQMRGLPPAPVVPSGASATGLLPAAHAATAAAIAVAAATRGPYDPPALKKRKVGESTMGDEDAAALLTDLLGRSSPPSSPRGNHKVKVEEMDDDADDPMDDQATAEGRRNGSERGTGPMNREHLHRTRRFGRGAVQRALGITGEASPSPTRQNAPLTPQAPSAIATRPSFPPSSVFAPSSSPAVGAMGPATTSSPSLYHHSATYAGWNPAAAAAAAAEMYKLYAGLTPGTASAANPSFVPATPVHDPTGLPTPALDPLLFQQQQQQLQILSQQLYNAQLHQTGSPAAASAYLAHHQPHIAQLALQQAQLQLQHQQQLRQLQQATPLQSLSPPPTNGSLSASASVDVKPKLTASASANIKAPKQESSKDDSSTDMEDGSESAEYADDGYSTPDGRSTRNGLSKRNKFFYKQLRDHLDDASSSLPVGFVDDFFFLMDPRLHVGPINRDGTFEKRVRLHFIEYLEMERNGVQVWLCWGTLLDAAKAPIFRRSSQFYRLPGIQSVALKSHSRSTQEWNVADNLAKSQLRNWATQVKAELEAKWTDSDISAARAIVEALDLPLPNSPPLDDKGDPITSNSKSKSSSLSKSLTASVSSLPSIAEDPKAAALALWISCGLAPPVDDEDSENSVSEDTFEWNAHYEAFAKALGVADHAAIFQQLWNILIVPNGRFSFNDVELAVKRFGPTKHMMAKMVDLLNTGAFSGPLSAAASRTSLNEQPEGTYLIRYSQSCNDSFVLCWRVDGSDQMVRVFNQANGGLQVELDGQLIHVPNWSTLLKSTSSITSPQSVSYKELNIPFTDLLADKRFQLPAESASYGMPVKGERANDSAMDVDEDSSSSSEADATHSTTPGVSDGIASLKLAQERSAEILSHLAKLKAQAKISRPEFQDWCLFISSTQGKDVALQLHNLLVAFREEPDVWINFAKEIIPAKPVM